MLGFEDTAGLMSSLMGSKFGMLGLRVMARHLCSTWFRCCYVRLQRDSQAYVHIAYNEEVDFFEVERNDKE